MAYQNKLYEIKRGKTVKTRVSFQLKTWQKLVTTAVAMVMLAGGVILLYGVYYDKTSAIIKGVIVTFIGGLLIGLWLALLVIFTKDGKTKETIYKKVDYTYNGITGETIDKGHEITREEFYGKKEE